MTAPSCRVQTCFLHIPKTGGTSLSALLERRFEPARICPAGTLVDYDAMSDGDLDRYDLLKGHFDYALIARLRRPAVLLTVLRDPVERVVSLYRQWRRSPVPPGGIGGEALAKRYDLGDFIDCGEAAVEWRCVNAQVYQIADAVRQDREPGKDQRMLELAKTHLRDFAFVGLSERLGESAALLCASLGWRAPTDIPRLNVEPAVAGPEAVDAGVRGRIEEVNALDRALYDFAAALLEERLRQ